MDNNPEIVTSVVSDEEDEVTTSPSLTFGVVDPRGQRTDYRYVLQGVQDELETF